MIELTQLQLLALSSLAFLGLMRLVIFLFQTLQSFMRPHVVIMELNEHCQELRELLLVAQQYVPKTTSEGTELHEAIRDATYQGSD